MIILFFLIIPIIYIIIKLSLYFIVYKFGKFSYDGFSAAGFSYSSEKNVFYSTKNAWQKKFGYCHLYDVASPIFRMIIDTEPIKFYYNNKNWLITFWKGQYGITTGGEVGIYVTKQQNVSKKTIYFPVSDDEMLDMSFILYKNDQELTRVSAKHWWLAVFRIGMFSKPKELTMDITINFPNDEMLRAFLNSFIKLKHSTNDYKIIDNTFNFVYKKPRTKRTWTRFFITDFITQSLNKKNVNLYNRYLSDIFDDDKIDDSKDKNKKLIKLNKMIPNFLKNSFDNTDVNGNKIYNSSKNVIILNDKVYSNVKSDYHEL